MNNQKMSVNIVPGISTPSALHASEGDVGRTCEIIIIDGHSVYKIPSTATVTITATKPSGMGFTQACTVTENGTATFETTASMTDESGKMQAEVRIVDGGQNIGTANLLWIVERNPHPSSVIDGDVEQAKTILERAEEAMAKAEQMIEEVEMYNSIVEEVEDARKGFDGTTYKTLGEAVRGQDAELDGDIDVLEAAAGIYRVKLIKNQRWPYFVLPFILHTGEWLNVEVIDYSGDTSNVYSFYLYNVETSQTVAGYFKMTGINSYKATSDITKARIIVRQKVAVTDDLYMTLKCYISGKRSLADITDNMFVYERSIETTQGKVVNLSNLPLYAEKGDVFELEVIDADGVLTPVHVIMVGYLNGGASVDGLLKIGSPFAKGTAVFQTEVDANSLRFYIGASYVASAGTLKIRYKNLTKMGLVAKKKRYSSFSILGDSYSSFVGYTNPTTNRQWYPTNDETTQGHGSGNNVTALKYMWWYILADETELYLNENASYSGSTISYDAYGSGSADGKSYSFIQRMGDVGKSSLLFIFGGTNDNWAHAQIGEYKYGDWTEEDLSYFAPALAYLIDGVRKRYIGMDIMFIENDALSADYKTAIETICGHYSVPVIKPNNVDKTLNHPNITGMRRIADTVKHFLSTNVTYPYYE